MVKVSICQALVSSGDYQQQDIRSASSSTLDHMQKVGFVTLSIQGLGPFEVFYLRG